MTKVRGGRMADDKGMADDQGNVKEVLSEDALI